MRASPEKNVRDAVNAIIAAVSEAGCAFGGSVKHPIQKGASL